MTPSSRSVVLVTGKHRPHEQVFFAFGALVGLTYVLGAPAPTSIVSLMPYALVLVWAIGLVTSGVVGLIGCWLSPSVMALRLEQGGLLINTGSLVVYTTGAFAVAGWRALFAAGLAAAWGLANLVRTWQANSDVRTIHVNTAPG